ncbi:MAG: CYTH domain-containing protein [Ilumatobacteraceae bacterium]
MDPGLEIELKFHIPAGRLPDVVRDLGPAVTHHLEAVYVDTPDDRLASAGLAWRLRRDEGIWVQTLKAARSDSIVRLEHEVPHRGPHQPPLDPTLHAGSEVGRRLDDILTEGASPTERFRTEIERRLRVVRTAGSTIELALDVGVIRAGGRTAEVCELELELVEGVIGDLVATAQQWARRHGLWIDTVTKSLIGTTLAAGRATLPVAPCDDVDTDRHAAPHRRDDTAIRRRVDAYLRAICLNASAVARGYGHTAHVEMACEAMCRLGAALVDTDDPTIDPSWAGRLVDAAARLGSAHGIDRTDLTALVLELLTFVHGPAGSDITTHSTPP